MVVILPFGKVSMLLVFFKYKLLGGGVPFKRLPGSICGTKIRGRNKVREVRVIKGLSTKGERKTSN